MMQRYDLYGFRDLDLEEARAFVESALGIRLRQRESSYRGICYCGEGEQQKQFLLEEDRTSTRFADFPIRLGVNDTAEMDAIYRKLTSARGEAVLLKSTVLAPSPDDDGNVVIDRQPRRAGPLEMGDLVIAHRHDEYAFRGVDLEQTRALVESALGVRLGARESSERGRYYSDGEPERLRLEHDETPLKFHDFPVRFNVTDATDMNAICEKLMSARADVLLVKSEIVVAPPTPDDDDDGDAAA